MKNTVKRSRPCMRGATCRSRARAQGRGGIGVELEGGRVEDDAVEVAGRFQGDVAFHDVALDALGRALERVAVAATAAGFQDVGVAGAQLQHAYLAVRELLDLAVGAADGELVGERI